MNARNPYLEFLMRWYWLLGLGLVIALGATHYALSKRVPLYRSTATVQIGRAIEQKNPEQNELAITDRLTPAYAELAKRDPVLLAVASALDLPLSPDDLRARLLVSPAPRTQLVDIHVVDEFPSRAAAIANEIARQLVLQSPNSAPEDSTQTFIRAQLVDLQQKITDTQAEITQLQDDIAAMSSAADVAEAQQRLATLQAQVDSWQQSYATLIGTIEPSTTNVVTIVSEATPAAAPMQSSGMLYYGLAAVIGTGFATLLALGLNMLNNAVQKPVDLGVLAARIPNVAVPLYRMPRDGSPIAVASPDSTPAAAYRALRNAIQTRGPDDPRMTIAVTSARTGEGKTTTAMNLAVVLANTGRSVVLVDANFRNPELSLRSGPDDGIGFSDALVNGVVIADAPTAHPSLYLLPAGRVPPNYADLLSSPRLADTIAKLSERAEVVIFDGPAIQEEQDALLLARSVDIVLVVVEARRTNLAELQRTLDALEEQRVLISIVLNKARGTHSWWSSLPWSRDTQMANRAARHRAANTQGRIAPPAVGLATDLADPVSAPGRG